MMENSVQAKSVAQGWPRLWLMAAFVMAGNLMTVAVAVSAHRAPASVTGRVLEVATGGGTVPVPLATIVAVGKERGQRQVVLSSLDGTYQLSSLEPGEYRLAVMKSGYMTSYYKQGIGATLRFLDGTLLVLSDGQSLPGLNLIALRRSMFTGRLSGRVTRASDGSPLESQGEVVIQAAFADFKETVSIGVDGLYQVQQLPAGNYYVTALVPGYARQTYPGATFFEEAQVVTVPDPPLGGDRPGVDFSLEIGGTLLGTVLRAQDSSMVEDARVVALDGGGRVVAVTTSENQMRSPGDYILDNLPLGSYRVAAWIPPWSNRGTPLNLGPEFYLDATSFEMATAIELTAGTRIISGVDFSLPEGARIQGRVLDDQGQPLADVRVIAQLSGVMPGGLRAVDRTDDGGYYDLQRLPAGSYLLRASAPGKISLFYDQSVARWGAMPVTVAEAGLLIGIDFSLAPGRSVDGVVLLAGQPVSGGEIILQSAGLDFIKSSPINLEGKFLVDGAPPASDYRLVVLPKGAAPRELLPIDLSLADQKDLVIDVQLGNSIGGQVLSSSGGGFDPTTATVVISNPILPRSIVLHPNSAGFFLQPNLPSIRDYRIVIEAPGFATEARANLSLKTGDILNLVFNLKQGRSISGKITIAGQPAPVQVNAYSPSSGSTGTARTRLDGTYTIQGLSAAADFQVIAGINQLQAFPYPSLVSTITGSLVGVDINIPVGSSLQGTVFSGATPLGGIRVKAWSPSTGRGGVAITNDDGRYFIEHLPSAPDYLLRAGGRGYATQFYFQAPTPFSATPVDLSGGSATGLDFELAQGARIEGIVLDTTGQPVQGARIAVLPLGGNHALGGGLSDSDGSFSTTPVSPGTYEIWARALDQPGRALFSNVVVGNDAVTGFVLQFGSGGSISGVVTLAGAFPGVPSDAKVVILAETEQSVAAVVDVLADGSYRTPPLVPGSYLILAQATGYAPRAYPHVSSLNAATPVSVVANATVGGIDFDLPVAALAKPSIRALQNGIIFGSMSAVPGVWTSASGISADWLPDPDAVGYNAKFDSQDGSELDPDINFDPETTSATSGTLGDGGYYLHVLSIARTINQETGLPEIVVSPTTHAGPFLLDTSPPPAPSSASTAAGADQILLGWTNPVAEPGGSGLHQIQVTRNTSGYPSSPDEGETVYMDSGPVYGAAVQFTDTSVANGVTYYYSIFAIDSAGNVSLPGAHIAESPSDIGEDISAPQSPEGTGAVATDSRVLLSWTNPSNGDFQGVEIRVSKSGYPSTRVQGEVVATLSGLPGEAMTFSYTPPGPGHYFFSIFAFDAVPNYSSSPATAAIIFGGEVAALTLVAWFVLLGLVLEKCFSLFGLASAPIARSRSRYSPFRGP